VTILIDRFKRGLIVSHKNKMNKCTIRLLRKTLEETDDDVIRVYEDPDFAEMYRVTFRSSDIKKASEFYLDGGRAVAYISTILKSLTYDTDPFEKIQVDTAIHPSVMYHVSDLDQCSVRHLIEDMIDSSLRRPVDLVR
jgi:hypothetical protein